MAEIKNDKQFKEYAETVLKKAFKEKYDEAKASEVIDGILKKCGDDYGKAVGILTSSLGESVQDITESQDMFGNHFSSDEEAKAQTLNALTHVISLIKRVEVSEDWELVVGKKTFGELAQKLVALAEAFDFGKSTALKEVIKNIYKF